jgi:integrase
MRAHGEGSIDQRGAGRWRLRYRVDGRRYTASFQGSRKQAQAELRRLLQTADTGSHVAPDKQTVEAYVTDWLAVDTGLSPKTRERYQQYARHQITPHLGTVPLQKLRPAQIGTWHSTLLKTGLHPHTVGHCHRVLHRGLQRAVELEILSRNVASAVKPPRAEDEEMEILTEDQVGVLLDGLAGHPLHLIATFALATGMRRGEICALTWGAINLDRGEVTVARSMEETDAGLRLKAPKSKAGRRTITLPPHVVEMLRAHYLAAMELRMQLGIGGRPGAEDWVFPGSLDGSQPYPPDRLSNTWYERLRSLKLPRVTFHALRHVHVSALIAAGLDIVAVSKRIGHSNPSITLKVYSHLFNSAGDTAAAEAIEKLFGSKN